MTLEEINSIPSLIAGKCGLDSSFECYIGTLKIVNQPFERDGNSITAPDLYIEFGVNTIVGGFIVTFCRSGVIEISSNGHIFARCTNVGELAIILAGVISANSR